MELQGKAVQHGFTLIELMIVVAIIGILAAIAIPQYRDYVTRSRWSNTFLAMASIKTAIAECSSRNAGDFSQCDTVDELDLRDASGDPLPGLPTLPGTTGALTISTGGVIGFTGNAQQADCIVTVTPTSTGATATWVIASANCGRSHLGF